MTSEPITGTPPDARPLSESEFATAVQSVRGRLALIAAAVSCNPADADDIVQEATVVALGKLGDFRRGTSLEAWMGRIVRNIALNSSRRQRRRTGVLRTIGARTPVGTDGTAPNMGDAGLAQALGELEETARVCLVLRVVGGMSYGEIARSIEIPEGTAMSHVSRARRRLRDLLGPGAGPSDGGVA
jgi:RNA polymerase sigma-70 factor (ECF subfamily)